MILATGASMESKSKSTTHILGWVATVLVIVGALNWALVGLFSFNLVAAIFGAGSALTRIIYVLVGASGLYLIFFARLLSHEAGVRLPRAAT